MFLLRLLLGSGEAGVGVRRGLCFTTEKTERITDYYLQNDRQA